jgi:predicted permease
MRSPTLFLTLVRRGERNLDGVLKGSAFERLSGAPPAQQRISGSSAAALFEAAMGPQIGGAIVAVQYGLNPPLVSLMVGVGISLSFFTLPLWSYALHHF